MTRRELLVAGGCLALNRLEIPLALATPPKKAFRMAVITDIHHGLAPDAETRFDAFYEAVHPRKDIDLILQLGDFCYSDPGSVEFVKKFQSLKPPKIQVLGNHDMDKCDKTAAMKFWSMKSRYGIHDTRDFLFVWLDLNHFKKNGELVSYANGNYFTDNATYNWADPEQLAWLEQTLLKAKKPVILLSHQPLGFAEPNQSLPPEQQQIVELLAKCAKANPKGAVAVSMFGHLHVDRLEHVENIPFYCVNSASYFWSSGMWPYTKPLFAFMEFTTDGKLVVEGVQGEFVKTPPKASDSVVGRSASIDDRAVVLSKA
ncbi:MAG: metallophosphoesterase [Armatimonadetes bacterium]|nr:metallophosphoesterase [Armatimonadota bacterium]